MVLILVSPMAVSASANGSDFTIENGVLTKYTGAGGDVVIPDSVTGIGSGAFSGCTSLASVSIPNSVTSIGENAFLGCYSLTNVSIPDSITSIGESAFGYCRSLTSMNIPNRVISIGSGAFEDCDNLTSVTIPHSVTHIGDGAFRNCYSLTSVTIPNSVTGMGEKAFSMCSRLTEIHVVAGSYAERWASEMGLPCVADQPWTPPLAAYASTQTVQVDGKPVQFQMYALQDQNGNLTNYVKARDVAQVLNGTAAQFNVTWDGAVNLVPKAAYVSNGSEMSTSYSGDRIYNKVTSNTNVNGTATDLSAFMLTDYDGGGYTYYKFRDLGAALGFNVGWNAEQGIMYIETDKPYQG